MPSHYEKPPGDAIDTTGVLEEAKKRWRRAFDYWSENAQRFKDQMRFVSGEQWDPQLRMFRIANRRPCLTMDRLGTHINQVVNDIRQNKPAIKTHPAGSDANVEVAEVIDGLIRNIEHCSSAPQIYINAAYSQVAGGQGAWRVLTRYVGDDSFDQEIYLCRIDDPTSVLLDPSAKDPTGADAQWGFVESNMSRDDFKAEYPDVDQTSWSPSVSPDGWWSENSVRLAEYYRIVKVPTLIHQLEDGTTATDESLALMDPQPAVVQSRTAQIPQVQWFKLAGDAILDSRVVPGKYIPLVKVVGNTIIIDGKPMITGLTWRAMDPQRMYNYQSSVVVELLSLQKSAPWIGAAGQFAGFEAEWDNANVNNPARLEYNPVTIGDTLAPPPQRQSPPTVPTGNVQAMQLAADDLQWVTGQHAANFGAKSNETSGRAILARQNEGDSATFHYPDNLANGILQTGKIIISMIPTVYDTRRVLRILSEDRSESSMVEHDPDQPMALQKIDEGENRVRKIYNIGLGQYDLMVSEGPSFGTRRMQAVEAMTQLLQGNPELWQAVGDIYIGSQDWPGAKEMSKRLKKLLPPNLQENEGEDPEAVLQSQVGQMQEALQAADQMMQERDAALQQADQMIQQMQQELEKLKQDALRTATDVEAKTRVAEVTAAADVRVAELNAAVEASKAERDATAAEVEELRAAVQNLSGVLEQMQRTEQEPEQEEGPDREEVLMEQLAAGQQAVVQAIEAVLAAVSQPKPPVAVRVERAPDGAIIARTE